jgi:hypothetical protein
MPLSGGSRREARRRESGHALARKGGHLWNTGHVTATGSGPMVPEVGRCPDGAGRAQRISIER